MSSPGTGRIVAELGRPETPQEMADRKAESARAHRANQTTRNLILALLASLAIVLFIVLIVVRPGNDLVKPVNYHSVAAQAQQTVSVKLADPALPKTWSANDAEWKPGTGNAATWYIGLITAKQQFIGLEQGISTGKNWDASVLGKIAATGHTTIDGVRWTVYNQRHSANPGNFGYSLAGVIDGSKFVLHGSADNAEFTQLVTALVTQLS
jgi:hypothetical protein